jgi:hypothetical protein
MDYVDWFMHVLGKVVEESRASLEAREFGVDVTALARTLFGSGFVEQPDYWHTPQYKHLHYLFEEMAESGLLQRTKVRTRYKLWDTAYSTAKDPVRHWQSDCRIELEPEQKELLLLLNRLSPRETDDHVCLESFREEQLLSELGWPDGRRRLWTVARELEGRGLIRRIGHEWRSSYRGLVWETRRRFTLESQFIDGLVAEWETTSVDFKRELHLDTASEKAEFVKDVIGLANTKASGRRWMIVGFDDKTREYHSPPDTKVTQNRIEQILAGYAKPYVDVRYEVVDYRAGKVGKLEVLREAVKLPYSVAKSLGDKTAGDKKRIVEGQIFVRHGSQTEEPAPDELLALQDEGDHARAS